MAEKLNVYYIKNNKDTGKSYFTKIGADFVNKDNSLNVVLDVLSIDGKLHIRKPKPKTESGGE